TGNKRIVPAHHPGDPRIALALPCIHRKHSVPSHQELLLLPAHVQSVTVMHVEVDAGYTAFHGVPGLGHPGLEVHFEAALPVVPLTSLHRSKAVVAARSEERRVGKEWS